MNKFSSTAIIALMTAAIGLSAVAPSMAQDAAATTTPAAQVADNGHHKGPGNGPGPMGREENGPRGGGFGGLLNFERGTEGIEIAFVRLSHAITLTDAQKPLLDDLKTTALAAATEFTSVLDASRPAADAATRPDVTTLVKTRIAVETAHAKALSTILPKLEAFTASLTDEQKAALAPARGERPEMGERGNGGQHRPGGEHKGQMNGQPQPMGADAPAPING
ncbi:Spy/CpxP family protein refolding chaperone [Devosia sp.]|uniref:Spy/CpxP family protein refolding chaperone n=1 Tax=Devosia sp. TaxID=1871048 RepID=UPI003267023F